MATNKKPKAEARKKTVLESEQTPVQKEPAKKAAAKAVKKVAVKSAAAKKAAARKALKKVSTKKVAAKTGLAGLAAVPKKSKSGKKSAKKRIKSRQAKCNSEMHPKIGVRDLAGRNDAGATQGESDPFEIAKQTMKGSVPAIVEAMVELAKQGSYSHAKTLLEMTGAKHMFDSEGEARDCGEPWAKLVLERLDEAESDGADRVAKVPAPTVPVSTVQAEKVHEESLLAVTG